MLEHWKVYFLSISVYMRPCIHYIHIEWPLKLVWKNSLNLRKMLNKAARSFVLKTKGTGSGIALLCGFSTAQARAETEERLWQESRTRVASSHLAAFHAPLATEIVKSDSCQNEWLFCGLWEKCCRWQQCMFATTWCESMWPRPLWANGAPKKLLIGMNILTHINLNTFICQWPALQLIQVVLYALSGSDRWGARYRCEEWKEWKTLILQKFLRRILGTVVIDRNKSDCVWMGICRRTAHHPRAEMCEVKAKGSKSQGEQRKRETSQDVNLRR